MWKTRPWVPLLLHVLQGHKIYPACRKSPDLHALTLLTPGTQQLVAFGGKGYSWRRKGKHHHGKWKKEVELFGDTWMFDLENRSWTEVHDEFGVVPQARWKQGMCAVKNDTALVLFGGCDSNWVDGVRDDLWVFQPWPRSLGVWLPHHTLNPPRARRGHVTLVLDGLLLVGGGKGFDGAAAVCLTDFWTLPLTALGEMLSPAAWVRAPDFPGGCRWGATATLMNAPSGNEVLALFGGRHINAGFPEHSLEPGAYKYYDELWLYYPRVPAWQLEQPLGQKPTPRDHHGAARVDGKLFVFGGRVSEFRDISANRGDVWSYSLQSRRWTEHPPASAVRPEERYMVGVAAVRWRGQEALAVFGGEHLPGSAKKTTLNDLWLFEPGYGTWTQLAEKHCKHKEVMPEDLEEDLEEDRSPSVFFLGCCLAAALLAATAWGLLVGHRRLVVSAGAESDEPASRYASLY